MLDPRSARKRSKAHKLAAAASAAADVRAYDTNPDVVAYRIERMRTRVDRLIWTGLVLGLLFTMANVQGFARPAGSTKDDIGWWIAWLLDPMVSLVLVGVLLGEQIIARHQIKAGPWVRRTKWTSLALTYAMNTWSAWTALDAAQILLHSVPPVMVFCAAEAVTTLRHQITEAVHKAYHAAAVGAETLGTATSPLTPAVTTTVTKEEVNAAVTDYAAWSARRAQPKLTDVTPIVTSSLTSARVSDDVNVQVNSAPPASAVPMTPFVTPDVTPALTHDHVNDSATPESKTAAMRAFWDAERADGRYPRVADLARVADADPSLASRLRKAWVEELGGWEKRKATPREKASA